MKTKHIYASTHNIVIVNKVNKQSRINMPELCICTKSQRPRLFFTFCFLFSFITVLISSLFFYYPDSSKTTPPSPSISFISDGGGGNSDRYVRYGFNDGGINKNAQYVMGPRPVRGRYPSSGSGKVEEIGRHYYASNGHQPPMQHHDDQDDPLLLDYIEGHRQDHHGEHHQNDPVMQNSELDSADSNNLERIRHQSHHPFERHHLSLSELEQRSNFSQIIDSRLIHLDLKGAPPKMSYIKDVSMIEDIKKQAVIFFL